MQIIIGLVLLIIAAGMVIIARPGPGQDSVVWLAKPWILGQAYAMAVLVIAVMGVSLIMNAWPS